VPEWANRARLPLPRDLFPLLQGNPACCAIAFVAAPRHLPVARRRRQNHWQQPHRARYRRELAIRRITGWTRFIVAALSGEKTAEVEAIRLSPDGRSSRFRRCLSVRPRCAGPPQVAALAFATASGGSGAWGLVVGRRRAR